MLDKLTDKFSQIVRQVSGKAKISEKNIEDAVEEIKIALLEADVNLRVVRRFVNRTIEEAKGDKVLRGVAPGQQFVKIVHDRMVSLVGRMLALHEQLPKSLARPARRLPWSGRSRPRMADRRPGLRAVRADGGGDRDCAEGEQVVLYSFPAFRVRARKWR